MKRAGVARAVTVVSLTLLAGCADVSRRGNHAIAEAPTYRLGDHWTYQVKDGFRAPAEWIESHEVTAIRASGITVRITQKGPDIDNARTEEWSRPGQLNVGALYNAETRRFETPLQALNFPLARGQSWNQWVVNVNETARTRGTINRYVRVDGWEKIATAAGPFDAIRIRVTMTLDDEEFWHRPTACDYVIWYAPAIRAPVREQREASYLEKSGPQSASVWTQHAVVELIAFHPGASPGGL